MKIAPMLRVLRRTPGLEALLVHTGQHFDERMSRLFFEELAIPKPDANLEVGAATPVRQTADIMARLEPLCLRWQPDYMVVVGDVNSTLAAALTAAKMNIPVAHVEAGLRSFDRAMPEEVNRVLVDAISDLLFVTEESAITNLRREGAAEEKIHFVGNVMIDTLRAHRDRAARSPILATLGIEPKGYAVVTLHRPSNVDDEAACSEILAALEHIARDLPVVFPVHPRARARMQAHGSWSRARQTGLRLLEPLGYLDFLKLMSDAGVVLTDSGGVQEETTVLGVPCLTLRENTERPVTLTHGTNRLAGTRTASILAAYGELTRNPLPSRRPPPLWDGCAAERIVEVLRANLMATMKHRIAARSADRANIG